MGALAVLALTIIVTLHGVVTATFFEYSPYDFNRHLTNFKNKNYQFWHQLYAGNFENQPFLRYSRPNYVASLNPNNNYHQWGGVNDVYGIRNTYNGEVVPLTESPIPKRTTRPRVTRTTKSRTTVSLSTAPWQSTNGNGASTGSNVDHNSSEASTGSNPTVTQPTTRPTKSPSSLLQQIQKINSTSQSVLGLLNKPGNNMSGSPKPSKSPSQLLQHIQKLNSSTQNFLGQLEQKPNTKDSNEAERIQMDGVWTTARNSNDQVTVESAPIHVDTSNELPNQNNENEFVPVAMVTRPNDSVTKAVEDIETTTFMPTTMKESLESREAGMVLISTSENFDLKPEHRHEEFDLTRTEATTLLDVVEQTTQQEQKQLEESTDPLPEDMGELEMIRREEYELEESRTTESMNEIETTDLPASLLLEVNEDALKSRTSDISLDSLGNEETPLEGSAQEELNLRDESKDGTTMSNYQIKINEKDYYETATENLMTDSETIAGDSYTTESSTDEPNEDTTLDSMLTTTIEPESSLVDDLFQFLLLDIIQAANALQNVLNIFSDQLGLDLNREFVLLQTLVIGAQNNGVNENRADKINSQIIKITSSFAFQRLRSVEILEKKQRLQKLGKLLKISVKNIE